MLAVSLAATSPLPTRLIRLYFAAELAGNILLEVCRYTVPFETDLYRILFCAATLPIRIIACMIVFKTSKWISVTMIPYAVAMLFVALHKLETITVDQWILILDGVVITYAGLSLAVITPFIKNRAVYGTLTILWVLLGMFDFGYVLQPYWRWEELNDSLLPVIIIGAFLWISLKTRWVGRTTTFQRPVS